VWCVNGFKTGDAILDQARTYCDNAINSAKSMWYNDGYWDGYDVGRDQGYAAGLKDGREEASGK
jgi:hypothetical protein